MKKVFIFLSLMFFSSITIKGKELKLSGAGVKLIDTMIYTLVIPAIIVFFIFFSWWWESILLLTFGYSTKVLVAYGQIKQLLNDEPVVST
ncbi:hypothetical protein [Marinibactrum halimedae]|uniref:hypothetical protein n=1 Tax=Marinibactrum halimedae TaxID=1444977 RepID=UPI001E55D848|nr:hypothetical protein [Marinibactrum halimedae]MCD9460952.1 hypothetical protein [Marinibactrum halimedae]